MGEKANRKSSHISLGIIVALYLLLGSVYSIINPILEGPDEAFHYPFVEYFSRTKTLPVQDPDNPGLWRQEGSQAPLYYITAGLLTEWVNTDQLDEIYWENPHTKWGTPLDSDNRNYMMHTPAEDWPWRNVVLQIHLVRFFSLICGVVALTAIYFIGLRLWPEDEEIAIFATALTAFNPMFIFITSIVSNDSMMITMMSLAIFALIHTREKKFEDRSMILLGITAALAGLTKVSGLVIYGVIGIVFIIEWIKTKKLKPLIRPGLILIAGFLLLTAWWYIRNIIQYQDLLGTKMVVSLVNEFREATLIELSSEWFSFFGSYWGIFGTFTIQMDDPFYIFFGILTVAGVTGFIWWVVSNIRKKDWMRLERALIPTSLFILMMAAFFYWTSHSYSSQGRLIYPGISAASLLTILGIRQFIPGKAQMLVARIISAVMLIIAAIVPFIYIQPAYSLPAVVESIPSETSQLNISFHGLEVSAVKPDSFTIQEGGFASFTVYSRINHEMDENISLAFHLFGRDGEEIGKLNTYPTGGRLATSLMEPGVIYETEYRFEIGDKIETPAVVTMLISAGLYDAEADHYDPVAPIAPDGSSSEMLPIQLGVVYPADMTACEISKEGFQQVASFGANANLWFMEDSITALPGDTVEAAFLWETETPTLVPFTIFVQLIDVEGNIIAQADHPPLNGDYPSDLWRWPCDFIDTHTLVIPGDTPHGEYTIIAGLYDAADPLYTRLPTSDINGEMHPDFAVPVMTIAISE